MSKRLGALALAGLLTAVGATDLVAEDRGQEPTEQEKKGRFRDPEDGKFDLSEHLETRAGFLPVPMIITEPAVGYGLALFGMFFRESLEQKKQRLEGGQGYRDSVLPSNVSLLGVAATENGTRAGAVGHLGFWRQDRVRYRVFALYPSANLDFFSIAGEELPRPIELNIEGPSVVQELKLRLGGSDWFAGVHQVYLDAETTLVREGDRDRLPPPGQSSAVDGFLADQLDRTINTSGLGALVEYDSRDNPFNPEAGYHYSVRDRKSVV